LQLPLAGAVLGNEKAFAAGADIKEMSTMGYVDVYTKNSTKLTDIGKLRKPVKPSCMSFLL
jgi:enoyl-CoA hydratase/carnithine racemase